MTYKGSDDNGIRRLKNLVDMRSLSTGEMYRIRNKFNNIDTKSEEYRLIGGDEMRRWIEKELENAKSSSYSSKKTKSDLGIENAFISNHSKQGKNGMAHTRKNNNVTFTYGE